MKILKNIFTLVMYLLLYAPIIVLIIWSFNSARDQVSFSGFTLKWYKELFQDSEILGYFFNTLILAIVSSITATILGTFAAVGISKMNRRTRSFVIGATNVPMTNPDIVTGISMAFLFLLIGSVLRLLTGNSTLSIFGFWTLLIAHITFNLPYVILSILPKLSQMDRNLTDAALDLGCRPIQVFFKVTLPQIMPGVVSGMAMAFVLSLDDFVISYFVSDPSFTTLPVQIYNWTRKPMNPKAYVLFTIIFVSIFIVLFLINMLEYKKSKKKNAN